MSIKVFIVDDSGVSRLALRRLLEKDKGFEIVGEASNGKRAIEQIPRQEVDIVLMDLMMPVMDGFDTTRWLMANAPVPILLVSDLVGTDAALNFRAVDAGALDVIRKPSADELADPAAIARLHRHIRILSDVPVVTRRFPRRRAEPAPPPIRPEPVGLDEGWETRPEAHPQATALVAIGASTGGPKAIAQLWREMDGPPPWPIIVVQHITKNFAAGMARWLGDVTGFEVELVTSRTPLKNGKIFVASDQADLVVDGDHLTVKHDSARERPYPSIDVTFQSIARSRLARQTLGILLTGMGSDGATGLKAIREAGGWTVAQDRDSCTVWGMPRAATEMGAAQEILSLDDIGARLSGLKGTDSNRTPGNAKSSS